MILNAPKIVVRAVKPVCWIAQDNNRLECWLHCLEYPWQQRVAGVVRVTPAPRPASVMPLSGHRPGKAYHAFKTEELKVKEDPTPVTRCGFFCSKKLAHYFSGNALLSYDKNSNRIDLDIRCSCAEKGEVLLKRHGGSVPVACSMCITKKGCARSRTG